MRKAASTLLTTWSWPSLGAGSVVRRVMGWPSCSAGTRDLCGGCPGNGVSLPRPSIPYCPERVSGIFRASAGIYRQSSACCGNGSGADYESILAGVVQSLSENPIKQKSIIPLALCGFLLLFGLSLIIPNFSVEYCTTKGYGFPFAWRVDHCLCSGGKIAYHPLGAVGNLLTSAVAAAAVSAALLRRRTK